MDLFFYHPWLFPTLATLFGLIIGSFINVVIHRLPKIMEHEWRKECADCFPEYKIKPPSGEFNLSTPNSHCPKCQTPIRVRDNIPLISWLLLKGKCHYCQAKISARYPLVELLSALLSLTIAYQFEFSYFAIALLFFTFVLIAATFIDLDTMLLPDQLTLPLVWSGITLSLLDISPVSLQDSVIGAIAGYLCLWSVYWAFKLITGKEGMGFGDFKLLAALGAWLGWQALPVLILLSSAVGAVLGIGLIATGLVKRSEPIPFGPYLALAGIITLFWGDAVGNLFAPGRGL